MKMEAREMKFSKQVKLLVLVFTIPLIGGIGYTQPFTPDEFTEALWHFDEEPGEDIAHDATGHSYDMILLDGAEFTTSGFFDNGVDLTDPDGKVDSDYLLGNGWDALTIDAFIFPTEITGPEHPIVERYRWHNVADPSYYLTILQNGSLVGGVYLNDPGSVYSSATTTPGTIETNQWYHVAMTWSSGEPTRIFLNGEIIAESGQVHEGTVRAGDDPLTIGWFHDQGYGDFYFQGIIDEVRISDVVRYGEEPPPTEITLTPYNPPIIIPPGGDALAYHITIANHTEDPAIFDGWISVDVPGGYSFTIWGPREIAVEAETALERDWTIFVPGNAPAGEYRVVGMIGNYPWNIDDADEFGFIKEGGAGDIEWTGQDDWYCTGEPFPSTFEGQSVEIPTEYSLLGNFPNPFNPTTTISFQLSAFSYVNLTVYDITGRLIAELVNDWRDAGVHEVNFNASHLASGLYFYRIEAGDFSSVQKMILMK